MSITTSRRQLGSARRWHGSCGESESGGAGASRRCRDSFAASEAKLRLSSTSAIRSTRPSSTISFSPAAARARRRGISSFRLRAPASPSSRATRSASRRATIPRWSKRSSGESRPRRHSPARSQGRQTTTLGEALEAKFEITAATPRFLEHWAELTGASELTRLAREEDAEERAAYPATTITSSTSFGAFRCLASNRRYSSLDCGHCSHGSIRSPRALWRRQTRRI